MTPWCLRRPRPMWRLHWTLKECDYPAYGEYWTDEVAFDTSRRMVQACFRAGDNGKIPYAYGPEQSLTLSPIPGKGAPPPFKYKRVFDADAYSEEVRNYARDRMNAFRFTPGETETISAGLWKISLLRFGERATTLFPWMLGLIIGVWLFAFALGWLVRGFAGIPMGCDFKADEADRAAKANRFSLEWLGTAIGGCFLIAGIGWSITKALSPADSTVGHYGGKVLHVIGVGTGILIGFGLFFAGAWGFEMLVLRILKREEPKLKPDDASNAFIGFGVANAFIVGVVAWLVSTYTFVAPWADALDHWSRANGFADGGTMAACGLCLLWPLLPLWMLSRVDARAVGKSADDRL